MDDRLAQPIAVIADHLSEWAPQPAHVARALFGSEDARAIAVEVDRFCREQLRGAVRHALWAQSTIGFVMGLELADARRVVVKGHQPERTPAFLQEVVRLQMHLASRGL